jgi:predicted DNA-binding protein (MmcQ/YjbR family)
MAKQGPDRQHRVAPGMASVEPHARTVRLQAGSYRVEDSESYGRENKKVNYQSARNYLLSRPEAAEDFPFGPEVAVFRIKSKMFALMGTRQNVPSVNLKCDPDEAQALRDIFPGVLPGYHMNKKHWNTVLLDGSVPDYEIERMMDKSYGLIVKGLRRVEREALELAYGSETIYR